MWEIVLHWIVIFLSLGFILAEPVIVQNPVNKSVREGNDVTLECVVEGLPEGSQNSVQWLRGNFGLGNDRNISFNERYSMTGDINLGEYNLHIKNVNVLEDDDDFECQVTKYGLRSTSAKVAVLVEPEGPFIYGSKTGDDDVSKVDVVIGQENELICQAMKGKPKVVLQWFKNDIAISEDVVEVSHEGPVDKLYNTNATLRLTPSEKDMDSYTCVMSGEAVESEKQNTVFLNLLEPPKVSVNFPDSIYENFILEPECNSYASPPVLTYNWYINGVEQIGEETEIINLGKVNQTWNNVKVGCSARNIAGESQINEKEINVIYSPIIIDHTDKVEADIGQSVSLSCHWDSNPVSEVVWTREGSATVLGQSSNLILSNVQQSDSGLYNCTATLPKTGENNFATSELIVNGPPLFNHDSEQSAVLGKSAVVRCSLSSFPGIQKVTWTWVDDDMAYELDGSESMSSDYKAVFEPGTFVAELKILQVRESDFNSYKCNVKNSYGEKSATIILKEDLSHAEALMTTGVAVVVGVGVVILILIGVIACCCYRKRQRKSTTFEKEKRIETFSGNEKMLSRDEEAISMNHADDAKSGAYKVRSSISSQDDEPASSLSGQEQGNPTPHFGDDGYHTEEAQSWNRGEQQEKTEIDAVLAHNTAFNKLRADFVELPPVSGSADQLVPSINNYPPRPLSANRNPYLIQNPVTALRTTSALSGRFSPSLPYMQRQVSDVSSAAASLYVPYSAVPNHPGFNYNLGMPHYDQPVYGIPSGAVNYPVSYEASQSSLDRYERESLLSGSAVPPHVHPPYESQGRNLHSRMSQSSKSSEFTRPLVARMATHV